MGSKGKLWDLFGPVGALARSLDLQYPPCHLESCVLSYWCHIDLQSYKATTSRMDCEKGPVSQRKVEEGPNVDLSV